MAIALLTTVDNPFHPIDDMDEWLKYDAMNGYGTNAYLARVAQTHSEMTDREYHKEIERAIDQIISNDFMHIYKKILVEDSNKEEIFS